MDTISIRIQDNVLQRLLMQSLIETIESDPDAIDTFLQQGVSPEFLDEIRHCKMRDLIAVTPSLKSLSFSFKPTEVLWSLQVLVRKRRDDAMREYFIINGASREMMCEIFKMSSEEVRAMRNLLLPDGAAKVGRASMPCTADRDRIHANWNLIQNDSKLSSQRDRIYALHQQFSEHRIDALCMTLREFGEAPRSAVAYPAKFHSSTPAEPRRMSAAG